jgi:hypothetical protein
LRRVWIADSVPGFVGFELFPPIAQDAIGTEAFRSQSGQFQQVFSSFVTDPWIRADFEKYFDAADIFEFSQSSGEMEPKCHLAVFRIGPNEYFSGSGGS